MKIIIDASVAAKWFFSENLHEMADLYADEAYTRFAPELLIPEFTNIICRKTREGVITFEQGIMILNRFLTFHTIQYIPVQELSIRSYEIAFRLQHPAYDYFYLSAAERRQAILVTADRQLYNRVKTSEYAHLIAWIENPPIQKR